MSGEKREKSRPIGCCSAIFIFIYLLDQAVKFGVLRFLDKGESVPVIPPFLRLTLVYNTGSAFGMFKGHPLFFIILSISFLAVLLAVFVLRRRGFTTGEQRALILIMAGTCGNLTDRLYHGHVVDFIDIGVWPVFNIADSSISIGVLVLAACILLKTKR